MDSMGLGSNEFARRDGRSVEILPGATRLSWPLPAMTTADSHTLVGRFACSAQLADNPTDRKMFAEMLLGDRSVLRTNELAEHFAATLRAAAVETSRKHPAESWTSGAARQEMIDALVKA